MGKLFCKHNYIMIFAEGYKQEKVVEAKNGKYVTLQQHCGCAIYCTKCGKQKKHLSKKIGKLYANTKSYNFIKSYEDTMKDIQIQIIRNHKIGEKK